MNDEKNVQQQILEAFKRKNEGKKAKMVLLGVKK